MREEEKKKRWSVTYTKHINRKRKVYQDGFLDLYPSTNKLMLYDESEKLLECRVAAADQAISSAQTLTFASYSVDVGLLHQSHLNSSSSSSSDVEQRKGPINLSPSQKIIRGQFKKRNLQKYGAPISTETSTITEWKVLYTTQLTQKSKKYHDGFLRLSLSGSLGRQVMLFDENRKLLESKFLKRDAVIRSGESISLDAHLVEIGECEGNNVQEKEDSSNDGKQRIKHEQKSHFKSDEAFRKDDKRCEVQRFGAGFSPACTIKSSITAFVRMLWNCLKTKIFSGKLNAKKSFDVMYTTQITQKAKKYHDGFLKLTNSGTLQRQIMLYDESKKLLNSRFLKKDEVIQSGESITFDGHLVDIGEPEENNQALTDSHVHGSNYNLAGKMMHSVQNSPQIHKSFLKGKPKNIACSKGHADPSFSISANIDERKLSQNLSANKPLRDAIQILSILQKPTMQESISTESTDKIMNPVPFATEPQNSGPTRNFPECSEQPGLSKPYHGSNEELDAQKESKCKDIKISTDFYSKVKSSFCGNKSLENIEDENPHQPQLESYTKCSEASMHGFSSPIVQTTRETKNSLELKISREADGCPSFALGFD